MSSRENKKIFIVVPCYNEQEVLADTTRQLTALIQQIEDTQNIHVSLLYTDDGSKDATWLLIKQTAENNSRVKGLRLAHNVGHQHALWAGMEAAYEAGADAIISIDADLQDDIDVIPRMVQDYLQGSDVVYGVRKERKTDTAFKRWTAQTFYHIMKLLGSHSVYNHADFRLLSRRALQALLSYPERNLYLRGMVSLLGFNETTEYYNRKERMAGESKYPFGKMLNFALEGITSFSVKPLRMILAIGFVFVLISIAVIIWAIDEYLQSRTIEGWTSLLVSVWFIGGVVLMALGVVGEYVGKMYTEVKRRPRYLEMERAGW